MPEGVDDRTAQTLMAPSASGAAAHDELAAQAIALRGGFPENWVPVHKGTGHDVVIVGGGQSGVAIAFALRRAGIARVSVIDAAQRGSEGIWRTTARMKTLRSPKQLPGPELDIPELSFRAWYSARFGDVAYENLQAIPRLDWADYLDWFRDVTGVEVRYEHRLQRIEPVPEGLRLCLEAAGTQRVETCRKLVLATGFPGSGGVKMPAFVRDALPQDSYAHSDAAIDFSALRGRRVAVFGAASSAFDAAASALEEGADSVHLFCRHEDLERFSRMRVLYYPGSVEHFRLLPDDKKWHIMNRFCRRAQGPVPDTVRRATRFKNFHLHLGARDPVVCFDGGSVAVSVNGRSTGLSFDFVIAGTGYRVDLAQRPELADIAERIALWSDRYRAPEHERNEELARYPYLTPGFAFTAKREGEDSFVKDIHLFTAGAMLSNGRNPAEVSGFGHGIPQLVSAIGGDLFTADAELHVDRVMKPVKPILSSAEFRHSIRMMDEKGHERDRVDAGA